MLDKYIVNDKRLHCEAELLNTLTDLLIKEYVMSEFITEANVTNVTQVVKNNNNVSDTGDGNKPSMLERIKGMIMRVWKAITGFFSRIWAAIKGLFTKNKNVEYSDPPEDDVDEEFEINFETGETISGDQPEANNIDTFQQGQPDPDPTNPPASAAAQRGGDLRNDQEIEQENIRLKQQIEDLEKEKQARLAEIEALKKDKGDLEQQLKNQPPPDTSEKDAEIERLNAKINEDDEQIKDLQRQIEELGPIRDNSQSQAKIDELTAQINNLTRDKEELARQKDAAESQVAQMGQSLSAQRENELRDEYQRDLSDALAQKDAEKQAELDAQEEAHATALQSEIQAREEEIARLNANLAQQDGQNEILANAVDQQHEEIERKKQELERKKQELEQLKLKKKRGGHEVAIRIAKLRREKADLLNALNNTQRDWLPPERRAALENELQQKDQELVQLWQQYSTIETERNNERSRADAAEQDKDAQKLRADTAESDLANERLTTSQLTTRNQDLEDRLNRYRVIVSDLNKKILAAPTPEQRQELQNQLAAAQQNAQQLQAQLDQANEENRRLSGEVSTWKTAATDAGKAAENMKQAAMALLSQYQSLYTLYEGITNDNAQLQERYNTLKENYDKLEEKNQGNEARIQEIQAEKGELEQKIENLKTENESLKQENEQLKQRVEELGNQNAELTEKVNQLTQKLDQEKAKLEQQSKEWERLKAEQENRINSLTGQLNDANQQLEAKADQIKALEQRERETSDAHAQEKQALNAEIERQKQEMEELRRQLEEQRQQNSELTERYIPRPGSASSETYTKYKEMTPEMKKIAPSCEFGVRFDPRTKRCTPVIYKYHVPPKFMELIIQLLSEFHNYMAGVTIWLKNVVGDQMSNETSGFSFDANNSGTNGRSTLDKAKYQMDTIIQQLEPLTKKGVKCENVKATDFHAKQQQLEQAMNAAQQDFRLADQYMNRIQQIQDDNGTNPSNGAPAKQNSKARQLANIMELLKGFLTYEKQTQQIMNRVLNRIKRDEDNVVKNAQSIFDRSHGIRVSINPNNTDPPNGGAALKPKIGKGEFTVTGSPIDQRDQIPYRQAAVKTAAS